MPPRSPARAASCSKASSHCPGKGRNGSIRDGFRSSPRGAPPRRSRRGDPVAGGPSAGRRIPSISAFTRVFDALCAGMNGSIVRAGDEPSGTHCSARPQSHENFTAARRNSTNGKPPGGDPAAPVRRRSCRGAGSATAGARLFMW
jgi:hypothetical protein